MSVLKETENNTHRDAGKVKERQRQMLPQQESQEPPGAGRDKKKSLPRVSRENVVLPNLGLGFLVSTTGKESISASN